MKYEYWLASLYKINSNRRRQACEVAGGAEILYHLPEQEVKKLHLFSENELRVLKESRAVFDLNREWENLEKKNIQFLPFTHPDYPEKLRQIYDPPYAVFVRGCLPDPAKRSVAIVGARDCSEYGRNVARMLGRELAGRSVEVISGMARGIDSAAHAGALETHGKTYAVLGNGCDICYPRSSGNIYHD